MTDSSLSPDTVVQSDKSPRLLLPVIGSLLLLLPLATAVQAWLADAPGKGWVTIFAVAALGAAVAGWWFFRGLLFLCGLLAAGALIVSIVFLYGSDSAAPSIAGLPMQLFVPGLFLATLALAAWELARLPKLPLWARFIPPVLAAFAAVPVVMGLIEGVPFIEVLVGLWTLPYWTQGAWLGAAILLPLALIVVLLRAAVPAWRDEPFRPAVALTAIIALLTASLATGFTMTSRDLVNLTAFVPVPAYPAGGERESGQEKSVKARPVEESSAETMEAASQRGTATAADKAANSPGAPPRTTGPAANRSAAQGGGVASWSALEAAVAEIPRERFDPDAVIARVGTDPEALFAWVRDETVLLPYCGALKGPEGVLLDRGGNTLDRALLLRELLSRAGHRSRLAHAELRPDQTAPLNKALERVAPSTSKAMADSAEIARRAAAEFGLDASALRARLDAAVQAEARLQTALAARTTQQSRALLKALASAGAPPVDTAKVLGDHWWVLLEQPGGELLDLDPSTAESQAGERIADAEITLDLTSLSQLALRNGACGNRLHNVRVRAVAEVFDGKKLAERVLLDHEFVPIESFGHSLILSVSSFGGPDAPDPFSQVAPADGLIAALLQRNEWQPRFTIGTDTVTGKVITDTGKVRAKPGQGGSPRGALGSFGGALGGGSEGGGRFTAFWWTFEVRTPGVGTSLEKRQVFDLIGPAARAAGATGAAELDEEARTIRALTLAGQTELIALPAAPTNDLANFVTASRLLAERDEWQALYDEGKKLPLAAIGERLNSLGALRTPLERFALIRGRFAAATGSGPQEGLLVVAHHRRLREDLSTDQAFDLIATTPGVATQDRFGARVRAGVADTNLEALLAVGAETRTGDPAIADAFARAPGSWRIVRHADDLSGSVLPADLVARVANDLDAGFVALVPTDARDAVGWWRIDPNTGTTLGLGSRGWGQATSEYAAEIQWLLQVRGVINQYAAMGQCLVLALTQPLQGVEGPNDELAECVFNLICGSINEALANLVEGPVDWTNVIVMATVGDLWGGSPEAGFGGLCGGLWSKLN